MNDSDDPFKELDEELDNLRERAQNHAPPEVTTETVIECDDELLTADTELTSDSDILAEFRPSDDELEEDDEVFIEEPPPKRPSKQDLFTPMTCYKHPVCLYGLITILLGPTLRTFQE